MNISLTPRIKEACIKALNDPRIDNTLKKRINGNLGKNATHDMDNEQIDEVGFPLDLLKQLSQFLLNGEAGNKTLSPYWLHELLVGSEIYLSKPKIAKRSEEIEQRLKSLSRDNQNQEYYQMVNSVDPNFRFRDTPMDPHQNMGLGENLRETNRQLTAIFNIGFTVVAVFVAVYWVSYTFSEDVGVRVLLSLFGALIVGGAESFLYVRYLNNRENQLRPL